MMNMVDLGDGGLAIMCLTNILKKKLCNTFHKFITNIFLWKYKLNIKYNLQILNTINIKVLYDLCSCACLCVLRQALAN